MRYGTGQPRFVVDSSVVMAWAFEDEASEYADTVLQSFGNARAVVPQLWPLEVANVLAVAERRGCLTAADSSRFLALLSALPVDVVYPTAKTGIGALVSVARAHNLSAYEASYLQLAVERGLAIATQNGALRRASEAADVGLWCDGG